MKTIKNKKNNSFLYLLTSIFIHITIFFMLDLFPSTSTPIQWEKKYNVNHNIKATLAFKSMEIINLVKPKEKEKKEEEIKKEPRKFLVTKNSKEPKFKPKKNMPEKKPEKIETIPEKLVSEKSALKTMPNGKIEQLYTKNLSPTSAPTPKMERGVRSITEDSPLASHLLKSKQEMTNFKESPKNIKSVDEEQKNIDKLTRELIKKDFSSKLSQINIKNKKTNINLSELNKEQKNPKINPELEKKIKKIDINQHLEKGSPLGTLKNESIDFTDLKNPIEVAPKKNEEMTKAFNREISEQKSDINYTNEVDKQSKDLSPISKNQNEKLKTIVQGSPLKQQNGNMAKIIKRDDIKRLKTSKLDNSSPDIENTATKSPDESKIKIDKLVPSNLINISKKFENRISSKQNQESLNNIDKQIKFESKYVEQNQAVDIYKNNEVKTPEKIKFNNTIKESVNLKNENLKQQAKLDSNAKTIKTKQIKTANLIASNNEIAAPSDNNSKNISNLKEATKIQNNRKISSEVNFNNISDFSGEEPPIYMPERKAQKVVDIPADNNYEQRDVNEDDLIIKTKTIDTPKTQLNKMKSYENNPAKRVVAEFNNKVKNENIKHLNVASLDKVIYSENNEQKEADKSKTKQKNLIHINKYEASRPYAAQSNKEQKYLEETPIANEITSAYYENNEVKKQITVSRINTQDIEQEVISDKSEKVFINKNIVKNIQTEKIVKENKTNIQKNIINQKFATKLKNEHKQIKTNKIASLANTSVSSEESKLAKNSSEAFYENEKINKGENILNTNNPARKQKENISFTSKLSKEVINKTDIIDKINKNESIDKTIENIDNKSISTDKLNSADSIRKNTVLNDTKVIALKNDLAIAKDTQKVDKKIDRNPMFVSRNKNIPLTVINRGGSISGFKNSNENNETNNKLKKYGKQTQEKKIQKQNVTENINNKNKSNIIDLSINKKTNQEIEKKDEEKINVNDKNNLESKNIITSKPESIENIKPQLNVEKLIQIASITEEKQNTKSVSTKINKKVVSVDIGKINNQSRKIETNNAKTTTKTNFPVITLVKHSATRILTENDELEVVIEGDPKNTAYFDIGLFRTKTPMNEVAPGIYRGTYRVSMGDNVSNAYVTGYLTNNELLQASMTANKTVTIDTSPGITLYKPENTVVDTAQQTIKGMVDNPKTKSVTVFVNETKHTVTVKNGNFNLNVALKDGNNIIEAMLMDERNNVYSDKMELTLPKQKKIGPDIKIISPVDGEIVNLLETPSFELYGTVDDPTITKGKVIGNNLTLDLQINNGYFYQKIVPVDKVNSYVVEVKDSHGEYGVSEPVTVKTIGLRIYDVVINLTWNMPDAELDLAFRNPSGKYLTKKSRSGDTKNKKIDATETRADYIYKLKSDTFSVKLNIINNEKLVGQEIVQLRPADAGIYTIQIKNFKSSRPVKASLQINVNDTKNAAKLSFKKFGPETLRENENWELLLLCLPVE